MLFNSYMAALPLRIYWAFALQPRNVVYYSIQWLAPIIAGLAIYLCRKWSFFLYLLCMTALFLISFVEFLDHSSAAVFIELILVLVINTSIVGYFLIPAVRAVYINPRLRWWESDARYQFEWPVTFTQDMTSFRGQIRNISNSGLFILSETPPIDASMISIEFVHDNNNYRFVGSSIQHGQQSTLGFGVRFQHDTTSRRAIRRLTTKLKALGKVLPERLPTKEDSFLFWITTLIKTGRGLIPRPPSRNRPPPDSK